MERAWLVAIVGPPAVGKMTVGQRLAARTGFALYHNHLVIDHLTPFFEFGSDPFERLVTDYRIRFFQEVVREGLGIVATWGWRFDDPDDERAIAELIEPFTEAQARVSFVELAAPLETRLARNRTENRRAHKRTDWATEENLSDGHARWVLNSNDEHPFPWPDLHLRIDNAEVAPDEAAARIQAYFGLPVA